MHFPSRSIQLIGAVTLSLSLPLGFWGCSQLQLSQQGPTTAQAKVEAGNTAKPQAATPVAEKITFDKDAIARIRDEGLNRSQVMATLSYLSDVIGPRLTGSPNLHHANEWTRDKLSGWGLENAHLEAWGPFGRGWAVKRFSAEVVEPQSISLIAAPKAWSGGFDQPITAEVVLLEPKDASELDSLAGKLEGKIVLLGGERAVTPHFTADGSRLSDEELQQLSEMRGNIGFPVPTVLRQLREAARGELIRNGPTTAQAGGRGGRGGRGGATTNPAAANNMLTRLFNFAAKEKAALICTPSGAPFDFGTMVVQSANVPGAGQGGGGGLGQPTTRPWTSDTPPVLPQVTISAEQYNRIVRMVRAGETVKMSVNLQVEYYNDDPMAYNTIAEIPGTDLKDQIVMLGGHMDSWASGTGATDNGAGVAVTMEAVRILKALDLKPRRTIRIALWSGEEEGLYGSAAYVRQHFGSVTGGGRGGRRGGGGTPPRLTPGPEYDKLSVYFNLDNGTGKIRGVYCQSNSAVMPIFKAWLAPFADLGATTVTLGNTDSTDHISFANVGLPAFQFIQDDIEYFTRTHHTNEDVFDRIQADDVEQASVIMAAFVYNAAMMDQRMPRSGVMTPATNPSEPSTQQVTQNAPAQ